MKFINTLYKSVETLICSNLNECAVGMGDTSYFIFDPIPIFSSPVSSISIPIPIPVN